MRFTRSWKQTICALLNWWNWNTCIYEKKLDDINREYRSLQISNRASVENNNRIYAENSRFKDEIIMLRKDIDELKADKDKG